MWKTTSAIVLGLALATPALCDTVRPKPRPQMYQLSAATVTPPARTDQSHEALMMLFQATSFVSAAGIVTGTPILPVLPQ